MGHWPGPQSLGHNDPCPTQNEEDMNERSPELMLRTAIPINDIHQLFSGPQECIVILWLDCSAFPDLEGLTACHEHTRGAAICTWFYLNPSRQNMTVGLRVEMQQPIRSVLHLAFKVARYANELASIARYATWPRGQSMWNRARSTARRCRARR